LVWGEEQRKAFREIKRALTHAPALGLPDVIKPFFLYVHEKNWTAIGILTQLLGSWSLMCQNNLMLFPEAGCLAQMPWKSLLS
jgi:hypothetical protein